MQCAACGSFFQMPATDNAPKDHYMFCAKCRCPSDYNYAYTAKEYEHENVTNQFYIGEKDHY